MDHMEEWLNKHNEYIDYIFEDFKDCLYCVDRDLYDSINFATFYNALARHIYSTSIRK